VRVVDNLGTHFTPEVREWLADNPNITFHRTPVGASWMNQIEIWFGLITRQAIRRGTFSSVKQLVATLPKFGGSSQKSTSLRDTSSSAIIAVPLPQAVTINRWYRVAVPAAQRGRADRH